MLPFVNIPCISTRQQLDNIKKGYSEWVSVKFAVNQKQIKMKRWTLLVILIGQQLYAQPENPSTPVPLDTHEWILLTAGVLLGGWAMMTRWRNHAKLMKLT